MVAEREPRSESRRHRNTSDHSEGEDNSGYEECVEDGMPSGECSRNGRRARLPEDPWERVSESSRVADMSEQVFFAIPMWPLPHEIHHPAQNLRFCEYRMDCPGGHIFFADELAVSLS